MANCGEMKKGAVFVCENCGSPEEEGHFISMLLLMSTHAGHRSHGPRELVRRVDKEDARGDHPLSLPQAGFDLEKPGYPGPRSL